MPRKTFKTLLVLTLPVGIIVLLFYLYTNRQGWHTPTTSNNMPKQNPITFQVNVNNPESHPKGTSQMMREERNSYAQSMFAKHPELFPEDRRQSILDGVVLIGMAPFEAKLAGGAFAYKVVADKSKWPENTDPLKIMWAQSIQADNSEIWMMFKNSSQFANGCDTSFRVYFEQGRAVKIEKLGGEEC